MSEEHVVIHSNRPNTVDSLAHDFRELGIDRCDVLLVHSSMGSIGWVCGAAQAVVLALEEALGPSGTLVMPTHSTHLSDPAPWGSPPVPREWWPVIRESLPAYDPDLTPTRSMGSIPECFRKQTGVVRSAHPHVSFAARGPHASAVVSEHSLAYGLGEGSPLARIYELDGWVLLLGVGHENNTSLHLAEHRADYAAKRVVTQWAPIRKDDQRVWVSFDGLNCDSSDFDSLGRAFNETGQAVFGNAGAAAAVLMRQRALVDYAIRWFEANRT
ncbi:MAG: AAC(3) family N-acetyltransferase [Candidatus Hydrogenedentes bacterium]|nr:AAC(3) family N-acetyltransferase [Candidatus Hydrogenedentota bacterium]